VRRNKDQANKFQAIAFWELALITDSFPDRRKTIYGELERKKAATFMQVTDICLAEIKFLIERLHHGIDPSYTSNGAAGPSQPAPAVKLVPQISQPLRDEKQITALPSKSNSRLEQVEAITTGFAKSLSSPGNAQHAYGREALNKGIIKAQQGTQQAESFFSLYYNKLVASPIGRPFQHSLERTANVVVLGSPYSRISLICNAVTALTNLTIFSLKQDDLGRFHEGVPQIIRIFTTAIKRIDEYMAGIEIHWSDFDTLSKPEAERRVVPQVNEVRECLREGLEKILGSFNEYLSALGLSKLEIMEAKKAVGVPKAPEMLQAR
jgi:nucleoporin NDC1